MSILPFQISRSAMHIMVWDNLDMVVMQMDRVLESSLKRKEYWVFV
jgi:stage III sporulation protein SpoIIIAA